jgi:ssDNA-binding Zn-finger/Zn-ribbon topoisomerase 1
MDEEEYLIDGVGFADPGGNSALRAATKDNPRDQPCPSCGAKNVLTRIDKKRGYQCDRCADIAEGRGGY